MIEKSNNTNEIATGKKENGLAYKWIALSNVTLASLMGTINGSIILISLPAIFNGIKLNPMAPNAFQYLIWILMGYGLVTATLLLSPEYGGIFYDCNCGNTELISRCYSRIFCKYGNTTTSNCAESC